MEEDIKILEEIIERLKDNIILTTELFDKEDVKEIEREIKAINNILNRYKELEEENKDIIYEERKYQNLNPEEWDKKGFYTVKRYKKKECIPISVIQNKIDELKIDRNAIKNEIEEAKKEKNKEYYADLLSHLRVNWGAIQVLQELLEERR